jgi:hypothetical protein
MKKGDLVRFVYPGRCDLKIGLLIEYHTWEKIVTVLHKDVLLRIQANDVEKAGKKDIEREKRNDRITQMEERNL